MVEPQIVILVVAGSSPVGHPHMRDMVELGIHAGFRFRVALRLAGSTPAIRTSI